MQVGDLVKVNTKHRGVRIGIILKPYYSTVGREWVVKLTGDDRNIFCCPSDLEVISAGR